MMPRILMTLEDMREILSLPNPDQAEPADPPVTSIHKA
jgi:hypothetical protein